MENKLSDKHLTVLNLILDGVPKNEAYMQIYKVKNSNTAGANANALLRNTKCIEYLADQRAKLESENLMSRYYKRVKLKQIVDNADNDTAIIAAIKLDNAMNGDNSPIQTEVVNSHDNIKVIVNSIEEHDEIMEMLNRP